MGLPLTSKIGAGPRPEILLLLIIIKVIVLLLLSIRRDALSMRHDLFFIVEVIFRRLTRFLSPEMCRLPMILLFIMSRKLDWGVILAYVIQRILSFVAGSHNSMIEMIVATTITRD